jgi:Uma2 family endonuclease
MSAVTFTDGWPGAGDAITVAELDQMPDDGRRYELLDGNLVMSPRPTTLHQRVGFRLGYVLEGACPDDLMVVPEPALQISRHSELVPDIVVARAAEVGAAKLTTPPLLVVEVRSPSTALIDLNRKKATYQKFGVPSYWIVDPDPAHPELTVFGLRDGDYALEAKTTQTITLERPFPVTIALPTLTRGLR